MGIRDTLRRVLKLGQDNSPDREFKRGKTPDEVELDSYKRQEYLQNVKKELEFYRHRNNQEVLFGNNPMMMKGTMFGGRSKNTKSKHPLMV
jgi:hypothetical protein